MNDMIHNKFQPKRFLLFGFECGGGQGGTNDLRRTADTFKECQDLAKDDGWDCYQIYDTQTGEASETV